MKLVTVMNFKGGCGKTFVSVILAELLMIAEKRAAVVDMDAQLNAVDYLRGMDGQNVFPALDVIASPGKAPDYKALRDYDFVVVDTPPQIITGDAIQETIKETDVFVIPICLQRHTLFGFEKTLELIPDGRPVIPVCSIGPNAKTRGKKEMLEIIKDQLRDGDGDLLPAVFLPWYDRVDENLSARNDFYYRLSDSEFEAFDALRAALFQALHI